MTQPAAPEASPRPGRRFPRYLLLDTAVASDNIGDEIIVESARAELADIFRGAHLSTAASHDGLGRRGRALAAEADAVLLLGTNALNPTFRLGRPDIWPIEPADLEALAGKVVLVGVGARADFDRIDWRQRRLLRHILSPRHLHSVRDAPAGRIVAAAGCEAANTSCPTLWRWRCAPIDANRPRAAEVVVTLTAHKAHEADRAMIHAARDAYEKVWFWPQQLADLAYFETLAPESDIAVLPPNLDAYRALLTERRPDYVGTRLHGGVFALNHGCRALIVSIDNRARDIGSATGLPILPRDRLEAEIADRLRGPIAATLSIDAAPIERFLAQFAKTGEAAAPGDPRERMALTALSRLRMPRRVAPGRR